MTDMPAYPSSSADRPAESAGVPDRPGTITGAFWAFVAATLVGVVGGVLLFFSRDSLVDAMRSANGQNGTRLTDAQIDQAATFGIAIGAVIALVVALLHLLFAFKLRAGRNWARIVLTVLTALQVVSLLFGQGTILGYISAVCGVVGVVLSFLPESSRYIAAAKTIR
ncbi:hypothetical protein [Amycolatopsis circi]|uniref:hypothetical protein n=1 Tax=Amycolatopsis circi TaxID=871959 RepID=UPI000E27E0E7|nr:hypothetical protein [Amycolatopsis circi]